MLWVLAELPDEVLIIDKPLVFLLFACFSCLSSFFSFSENLLSWNNRQKSHENNEQDLQKETFGTKEILQTPC